MQVTLDDAPHPITDDGRRRRVIDVPDGATVQEIVEGELKSRAVDMEIILDGREVVADANVPPPEGAVITVRPRLRGGLGRIIGTLAVIAAAIFIPPLLGLEAGTLAAALASAAITVIGGLVVNALFPPELPDVGQHRVEGVSNPNPAQLFGLSGGSNRARRYEPLPLVLGEHRVFPDQAAVEYTENEGDEQYLNAIYNFGLGDLDVSDLRVGPTPLTDFADVSTQWSNAAGKITLVAGNVDTAAGAALTDTNWVSRTTGGGSIRAQVDFGGRIFKVDDRGKHLSHTVGVEVRFSKSDTAAVTRSYNLTHGDSGTYRRTVKIALPEAGEWDIEVRRTAEPDASDRVYDEVTFSALRSYQPDDGDYRGQTRLAIRVRASGQLNGRLDRLSGLVKQKLPIVPVPGTAVWGAGKVATRNPAALFVALCRGFSIGGRPVAGVGLEDSRIDLAGLAAWYDWCHTREYKCDLVIQGPMTRDAALRLIARRGRATLSWKTGKLGVVYEDSAVDESTMITPANIIAGSFSVNWNSAPPSDEIVVRYVEPDMDWEWNSVRRNRPGVSGTPQSTTTITAKGVTDREQAAVIANLQAARQEYHPRRLAWEMNRPGRDVNVGDVVWITHSLIDSGIAGRLKSASDNFAVLDRAPADVTGGHILLRLPDGELVTSEMTVDGDTVTLAAPPDDWPGDATDTIYRLYPSDTPPARARIIEAVPVSATRFRFTAIDEITAYHTAATSDLTVPIRSARLNIPRVISVVFSAKTILVGDADMIQLEAALTVAGNWEGGVVRAGTVAGEYRTVDRLSGPADLIASWIIPPETGQFIQIIPGTDLSPDGPVWTGSWGWRGITPPPVDVTGFSVTEQVGNVRAFRFTPPDTPHYNGVLIRLEKDPMAGSMPDWSTMAPLVDGLIRSSPFETQFPLEGGEYRFVIRVADTLGQLSPGVSITKTLQAVSLVGDITAEVEKALEGNPAFAEATSAAERAETAADEAAASATGAATSETDAGTAATNAAASAVGAAKSKTDAETAATNAAASALEAGTSATAADGSATAAAGSATTAAESATAADGSATSSAEHATAAATQASAAAGSAAASATSAGTASSKASEAETSADAASADRVLAEAAKDTAAGSATAAAGSATNASGSATAAAGSATSAATQATAAAASAATAATEASAASSSANTASTKASEASSSADAASADRTLAQTAAGTAGDKATAAGGSATNASGSATAAARSATSAATRASAAATSATAAGRSATAAATSAQTASSKATEAGASASSAQTQASKATTEAGKAAASVTTAAASQTAASGSATAAATSATAARLSAEASAGSASDASTAVAGLDAKVSKTVSDELGTQLAGIVALRAKAGSAESKLELVAISDVNGDRATGIVTGDFQSDSYRADATTAAVTATAIVGGVEFEFSEAGAAGNTRPIQVVQQNSSPEGSAFARASGNGIRLNIRFFRTNTYTISTELSGSTNGINWRIPSGTTFSRGDNLTGELSGGADEIFTAGAGWKLSASGAADIAGPLTATRLPIGNALEVRENKIQLRTAAGSGILVDDTGVKFDGTSVPRVWTRLWVGSFIVSKSNIWHNFDADPTDYDDIFFTSFNHLEAVESNPAGNGVMPTSRINETGTNGVAITAARGGSSGRFNVRYTTAGPKTTTNVFAQDNESGKQIGLKSAEGQSQCTITSIWGIVSQ